MTTHQGVRGDRLDRGSPAGASATSVIQAGKGMVTGDQADRPTRRIMVTGARGGQGASTVAAALALHAAASGTAALVAPTHQGPTELLGLPPMRRGEVASVTSTLVLATPPAVAEADTVVIDGGMFGSDTQFFSGCESYVVLRGPCYIALSTLLGASAERPDGIILVAEEGRSLTAKDVTAVSGLPVVATVEASPRVARTLDAGLLVTRLSRLRELRDLRHIAEPLPAPTRPQRTLAAYR